LGKAIVRPVEEEFRSRARFCVKLIQFVEIALTSSGAKPVIGARNSSSASTSATPDPGYPHFPLVRSSNINLNDGSPGGALLRTRCRPQIGETITSKDSKDRVTRHVAAAMLEHRRIRTNRTFEGTRNASRWARIARVGDSAPHTEDASWPRKVPAASIA
jgi:hypothetical protein